MSSKKLTFSVLTFIFSFLFINYAKCQENYLPGSIINLTGDTIKGFVDYRNWENNPVSILFRESASSKAVIYKPNAIRGFSVHKELYLSATVAAETSPNQTNELNYLTNIHTRIDTAFLQVMFQGTKSLYYYSDRTGKQNFYLKEWPDFELLVYKKYLKEGSKETGIAENKTFLGQLTLYLQDCPTLQSKINNTSYDKKSLENLFNAYYSCSKDKISYQYIKEKPKTYFGVLAGMSMTTLNLVCSSTEAWNYIANVDYSTSYNISAGLYMDYVLARNQAKWSIYNELLFSTYTVSSHNEHHTSSEVYTIYDTKIGTSYLKVNNMLRFTYPVSKDFFVFINSGFSNGYAIGETNSFKKETKFYAEPVFTSERAINETRKWEFGILAGLGAKYQKFSFETRYERGNGMSPYTFLVSKTDRIFFLFGYRFK